MALPTSGSLSIKDAAGSTRSIACEVDGNITGNKSLTTLSVTASKTAPHSMLEFYGYSGGVTKCIGLHLYFSAGVSGGVCRRAYYCLCSVPDFEAGDGVTANICYYLINGGTSSVITNYSCYLTCVNQYYCENSSNNTDFSTYTFNGSYSLSSSNKPRVCLYACANNNGNVQESATACACACIYSLTSASGSNFIIDSGNQIGSAQAADSG